MTDAVAAGARAIVAITAGLSEAGAEGARLEAEALRDRARRRRGAGRSQLPRGRRHQRPGSSWPTPCSLPATWPCSARAATWCSTSPASWPTAGWACPGSSRSATRRTSAVVDFLHACVDHEGTRAVAVYTEDVVDGRAFLDAARALRDAGKPLVLLAPGRTEAAVRSAASHTGSLTSSSMVVDAACAAVGAHRVDHPTQMADLLVALRVAAADARPPGRDPHRRRRARSGGRRRARGGRAGRRRC